MASQRRETILSTLKPGQKAKIPGWMNFSELVQALVEAIPRILEYEGNTPGEKLSRALDRAEGAVALRDTLKLVYVLATSGVAPSDERWKAVIKQSEGVLWPEEGAPRER